MQILRLQKPQVSGDFVAGFQQDSIARYQILGIDLA